MGLRRAPASVEVFRGSPHPSSGFEFAAPRLYPSLGLLLTRLAGSF